MFCGGQHWGGGGGGGGDERDKSFEQHIQYIYMYMYLGLCRHNAHTVRVY